LLLRVQFISMSFEYGGVDQKKRSLPPEALIDHY